MDKSVEANPLIGSSEFALSYPVTVHELFPTVDIEYCVYGTDWIDVSQRREVTFMVYKPLVALCADGHNFYVCQTDNSDDPVIGRFGEAIDSDSTILLDSLNTRHCSLPVMIGVTRKEIMKRYIRFCVAGYVYTAQSLKLSKPDYHYVYAILGLR